MASPPTVTLSALLRRYRLAAGLTQEELAEKAGLSVNAISTLERGISRMPRRDTIALLADALGLQAAERAMLERAARQRESHTPLAPRGHEGSLPAVENPPYVGRAAELAAIDRALGGEGPPLLLIAGEPGIGKSRLLAIAAERARAAGWAVVHGACHRRSDSEPYAPFPAALLRLLSARSPAQQRLDLQGCGWLSRLLPELTEAGILSVPTWTLPPDQERRLIFAAVGQLLVNVARPAGTLLLLDDMQWAGADALALLAALLHGVVASAETPVPLRAVVAYRQSDITPQHALAALIADFAREGLEARLPLGPLAPHEAATLLEALLAEDPGEAERERMLRIAEGVPYFLVSIADEPGLATATESVVPWSVGASIQQRMAALAEPAREVVTLVAIAGSVAPRRVVLWAAAALGHDERQCVNALDEAIHARLVAESGDDAYGCAHELIREAVVADLTAARRGFLHRLIGEAIEQLTEPERLQRSGALAWHFARAGIPERALPKALLAGDRAAAVYAHAEAERHYRMALDLARTLGNGLRQAAAAEGLGIALGLRGRSDEALRWLEAALAAALEREDWAAAARIALPLTRPYVDLGRPHEGIARIEQARLLLAAHEPLPEAIAALDLALTHLYYGTNQYADMLAAAERALATTRADTRLRAHALWRRGSALLLLARIEEALPDLETAAELAARMGDLSPSMWAWHNAALARLRLGTLSTAGEAAAHALAAAETLAAPDWLAAQLALAVQVALEVGAQPRAREIISWAEKIAEQMGADWARAMVAEAHGRLALAEDDTATAGRMLDIAQAHAELGGDLQRIRAANHLLAERDLLLGEPVAAIARLTPLLDRPSLTETDVNTLLPTLAEAYLAAGDVIQAEALVVATCARLRAQHDRFALAEALRVRALVALHRRQGQASRDEVRESLDEALALCHEMGAERVHERVAAARAAGAQA